MPRLHRRNFLKLSGLSLLPAVLPAGPILAAEKNRNFHPPTGPIVKFFYDGELFDPAAYIAELQKIQARAPIQRDFYGQGGAITALEKKFAGITGKESAIFMPSGTLANQLAIAVLSGDKTKVFVQDLSHVYRDEADAAQSVFQKRLMPLARGEAFFTAEELRQAIASLDRDEVFKSGIGAVSIENPVRRSDGRQFPLEEIKKISAWCRSQDIRLHLDGARLHMAAAWSGTSIKEYSSLFDTVYISLYKYLGASAGAILCGDKKIIDKMPHLIKIHGGNMFGNWFNAAMALDRLERIDDLLGQAVRRSEELFAALNKLPGIKISTIEGGTNIYTLELEKNIDGKKLQQELSSQYAIRIPPPNEKNKAQLTVNETILYRETGYITDAFKQVLKQAGG